MIILKSRPRGRWSNKIESPMDGIIQNFD